MLRRRRRSWLLVHRLCKLSIWKLVFHSSRLRLPIDINPILSQVSSLLAPHPPRGFIYWPVLFAPWTMRTTHPSKTTLWISLVLDALAREFRCFCPKAKWQSRDNEAFLGFIHNTAQDQNRQGPESILNKIFIFHLNGFGIRSTFENSRNINI